MHDQVNTTQAPGSGVIAANERHFVPNRLGAPDPRAKGLRSTTAPARVDTRGFAEALDRLSTVNGGLANLVDRFHGQVRRLGGDFPLGCGGTDADIPDGQVAMLHASLDGTGAYLAQLEQIVSRLEGV